MVDSGGVRWADWPRIVLAADELDRQLENEVNRDLSTVGVHVRCSRFSVRERQDTLKREQRTWHRELIAYGVHFEGEDCHL